LSSNGEISAFWRLVSPGIRKAQEIKKFIFQRAGSCVMVLIACCRYGAGSYPDRQKGVIEGA
jgi:hypothetical protein